MHHSSQHALQERLRWGLLIAALNGDCVPFIDDVPSFPMHSPTVLVIDFTTWMYPSLLHLTTGFGRIQPPRSSCCTAGRFGEACAGCNLGQASQLHQNMPGIPGSAWLGMMHWYHPRSISHQYIFCQPCSQVQPHLGCEPMSITTWCGVSCSLWTQTATLPRRWSDGWIRPSSMSWSAARRLWQMQD